MTEPYIRGHLDQLKVTWKAKTHCKLVVTVLPFTLWTLGLMINGALGKVPVQIFFFQRPVAFLKMVIHIYNIYR